MRTPERLSSGGRRRLAAAASMMLASSVLLLPAGMPAGAASASAVTATKSVSRIHIDNGSAVVADKRKVTVSVSDTTDLRDRQEISIAWSGARPTLRTVNDPNSSVAALQEYPVVILECRGVDSASAPRSQQVRPETCWTQTADERYFDSANSYYPPWRVDRYATASQRGPILDAPKPVPSTCFPSQDAQKWLPFVAVDGKTYYGGPSGCAGIAPEENLFGSTLGLPGNATYGATQKDGRGSAKFDVWTTLTNASLGCSPTVRCSLEVIPIEGISCDVAALDIPADEVDGVRSACEASGGDVNLDYSVTGALWWSASNWRNRIHVPLHFAPLPTQCDASSGKPGVAIYGSELMTNASLQWGTALCDDPKLPAVTHVQTAEPEARNLLQSGNTDAAYTAFGQPGGYPTPVVNAPVAMTGFAIAFDIDDANYQPVSRLRLTPRLLAKLLTESYPAVNAIKTGDAELSGNPLDVAEDPEFHALNPNVPTAVANEVGASTVIALSSDSDVIRALTSYIGADPEARAWLNGAPDPWGMVVNPAYKGISLPTDSWPLLDQYEPTSIYDADHNQCLHDSPVPYLPLVASPQSRLATIALDMQYAISPSQLSCQLSPSGTNQGEKLVPLGRQAPGYRFLLGVTTLADAAYYQLPTAALQTAVSSAAPAKFIDGTGRTFVTPSSSSLSAAASLLAPDATTKSWTLPYDKLVGNDADGRAYPGALLVSASIPTVGLSSSEAKSYASFLRWAVTVGQQPGVSAGKLPPGYLPLNSSHGLGAQASYTRIAAQYIAAQNGKVPALNNPIALTADSHSGGGRPGGSSQLPTSTPGSLSEQPGTVPADDAGAVATGNSPRVAAPAPASALSARTSAISAGLAGGLLPILACAALGSGAVALAMGRRVRVRRR